MTLFFRFSNRFGVASSSNDDRDNGVTITCCSRLKDDCEVAVVDAAGLSAVNATGVTGLRG